MNDPSDDKTRVTAVVPKPLQNEEKPLGGDCIVIIYTKEPSLLGKRFVLDGVLRIGRGQESSIVLEGDSVSRRHAIFTPKGPRWVVLDDNSTNGTYVNDEVVPVGAEVQLHNGDRVKIGPTIFKYLTGHDVEAQYHGEIYRMTIIDGLTGAYVKRYLVEAMEKEITRARRYERALSFVLFDIDHFKKINDFHGHLAGDHVLKELAHIVQTNIRRDEIFARYGGEEFALLLPETPMDGALLLAEKLRQKVEDAKFTFQNDDISVTISGGISAISNSDRTSTELIQEADEKLYQAKGAGRNRIVS